MADEEKKQKERAQYIKELQIEHIKSLKNKLNSSALEKTTDTASTELSYEDGVLLYLQFLRDLHTRIKDLQKTLQSDYKNFIIKASSAPKKDMDIEPKELNNCLNNIKNLKHLYSYLIENTHSLARALGQLSQKNLQLGATAQQIINESNLVLKTQETEKMSKLESFARDHKKSFEKNFPRSPASLSHFFEAAIFVLDDDDETLENPDTPKNTKEIIYTEEAHQPLDIDCIENCF